MDLDLNNEFHLNNEEDYCYRELMPCTRAVVEATVSEHILVAIEAKKARDAFEGAGVHVPTTAEVVIDLLEYSARRQARRFDLP